MSKISLSEKHLKQYKCVLTDCEGWKGKPFNPENDEEFILARMECSIHFKTKHPQELPFYWSYGVFNYE